MRGFDAHTVHEDPRLVFASLMAQMRCADGTDGALGIARRRGTPIMDYRLSIRSPYERAAAEVWG
jgi:hypothetical protein